MIMPRHIMEAAGVMLAGALAWLCFEVASLATAVLR